jgi:hypothetical protein
MHIIVCVIGKTKRVTVIVLVIQNTLTIVLINYQNEKKRWQGTVTDFVIPTTFTIVLINNQNVAVTVLVLPITHTIIK